MGQSSTIAADKLGLVVSWGCLVHCLLLPFLIPALPGLSFLVEDGVHELLAILVFATGMFAFYRGYLAHHHMHIFIGGGVGLGLLLLGLMFSHSHAWGAISPQILLTVLGSVVLIASHLANIRHSRCAERSPTGKCSCAPNALDQSYAKKSFS